MLKPNPLPSAKALPTTALLTYFVVLVVFGFEPDLVHAGIVKGFLTAFTPILIIGGAILLFKTMEETGSMQVLKTWLKGVSGNKIALLMIVGWAFPFLLEGASGFGTPVAIAAPILAGLGFPPLRVAFLILLMNTAPVSFGAVGTPTWFGFSGVSLTAAEITDIGVLSAWIHAAASLVIPLIALSFVSSWKSIGRNLGFIVLSLLSTLIPFVLVAYFNYEFPALVGGAVGTVCSVLFAKLGWGLSKQDQDQVGPETGALPSAGTIPPAALAKAFLPLAATLLVLIITRIPSLGLKGLLTAASPNASLSLGSLGTLSLSPSLVLGLRGIFGTDLGLTHQFLYVPSILPFGFVAILTFLLYRTKPTAVAGVWSATLRQMRNPALALWGALIFVELLTIGGDRSGVVVLGNALASVAGAVWPAIASLLGALGAFFSGSNTISNLTFGGIQDSIAAAAGYSRTTILALQSVGGAMGHMVAIHSIVAACTVLNLGNQEGLILRKVFPSLLVYAAVAAVFGLVFAGIPV